MIYNEFSENNGNIFLSSNNGLYQISLQKENDGLWKDYLDIGQFEKAKGHCPEKIKKAIHRIDAENEFQKNKIVAANKYALSDEKLELICLKYLKEGDFESLKAFLEIYKFENIKQEENKELPKDEALKLNLIDTWIIELYLNDSNTNPREFANLIKPNRDKINSELIYQMLIGYGKTAEYEKYSQLMGDYKRIISRKINQGDLKEAFNSISDTASYLVDNPEDNKKILTLLANLFLENSHLFFQKFPIKSFSFLIDVLLKLNLDINNIIENSILAIMSRTDKDVSKAKDFVEMFASCSSLQNVDGLINWKVSKGYNFTNMFKGCFSLQNVDGLKNWDVSYGRDFESMFKECYSLKNADGLINWNVSKAKKFAGIFSDCTELPQYKIPKNIKEKIIDDYCPYIFW
jgi:hypothetical protein